MKIETTILTICILLPAIFAQHQSHENEAKDREGKIGFVGGALTQIAQDLFSRSATNSQVLSLNLTNLVILLVVKALIFGAGHLGFGGNGHGRSVDDNNVQQDDPFMSDSELLLMLSYLQGDITQDYSCLHYSGCEDPKKTKEYITAARFLQKGAGLLNLGSSEKYEKLLLGMQDAADFGSKGYECSARFTCQGKKS